MNLDAVLVLFWSVGAPFLLAAVLAAGGDRAISRLHAQGARRERALASRGRHSSRPSPGAGSEPTEIQDPIAENIWFFASMVIAALATVVALSAIVVILSPVGGTLGSLVLLVGVALWLVPATAMAPSGGPHASRRRRQLRWLVVGANVVGVIVIMVIAVGWIGPSGMLSPVTPIGDQIDVAVSSHASSSAGALTKLTATGSLTWGADGLGGRMIWVASHEHRDQNGRNAPLHLNSGDTVHFTASPCTLEEGWRARLHCDAVYVDATGIKQWDIFAILVNADAVRDIVARRVKDAESSPDCPPFTLMEVPHSASLGASAVYRVGP